MDRYFLLPGIFLATALVAAYAIAPVIWLTKSRRALALRRTSATGLIVYWSLAILPWIAVLVARHFYHRISLSINGIPELIIAVVVALVLIWILVSLPLFAIALSVMWKLDRRA